jgi:radical SAM protein with 4Fe4S-binding SPASM domain
VIPDKLDYMREILNIFKKKKDIKNTICVLPWLNLNFFPDGMVLPCCELTNYTSFGNVNHQTIEEIWNNNSIKLMRKQMIKGIKPRMCSKCFDYERLNVRSSRFYRNEYFKNKLKEIPEITKKDGSVDKVDLRGWDFRFSNFCNNKCRYCGPYFSSSWIPDAKKLGWISKDATDKPTKVESICQLSNMDFLKTYIDTVEQINFVGGEPLLTEEHWQILNMLDERKKYNVKIMYNTNLSILKYKNKNAFDFWAKCGRNIELSASIDEIDERAELIRSGTIWKNVEANLKAVSNIGIHVMPSITVSAMNVFRLPEIFDRMIEIGVIKQEFDNWNNFLLNILWTPPMYHMSILPDEIRLGIREKLEKFIRNYEEKYNVEIRSRFLYLFEHLEKPWNKKNCREFIEFTDTLDKIRGENTWKTIPELNCIKEVK